MGSIGEKTRTEAEESVEKKGEMREERTSVRKGQEVTKGLGRGHKRNYGPNQWLEND